MRKIWCFWANLENFNDNRKNALNTIRQCSGVELELVTSKTLYDYQINNSPIHKGFYYLSDTDKSDYARCYLTHHYGGGYTDLKPYKMNWSLYFDILSFNDNIDLVGCQEPGPWAIANPDCIHLYENLVSVNKFIMKKKSTISTEWFDNMNLTLDKKLIDLIENPGWYHPRAVVKTTSPTGVFDCDDTIIYNSNYPLNWGEICGLIFHKVQSKYPQKIVKNMLFEMFSRQEYR